MARQEQGYVIITIALIENQFSTLISCSLIGALEHLK